MINQMDYKGMISSSDSHVYYASSLESLNSYINCMLVGVVDDKSYEGYDYPCYLLVREYEEVEVWEGDVANVMDFVNIRNLDEYLNEINMIKDSIGIR